jgi:hypothetical protein
MTEATAEATVRWRLAEAGATLMALKDRSVFGDEDTAAFWFGLVEAAERTFDLHRLRTRWEVPSAAKVQRMLEALSWLRHVDGIATMLVATRALRVPGCRVPLMSWKSLAEHFDTPAAVIRLTHQAAIREIARSLQRAAAA